MSKKKPFDRKPPAAVEALRLSGTGDLVARIRADKLRRLEKANEMRLKRWHRGQVRHGR